MGTEQVEQCDCLDGGHDDGTGKCLCGGEIARLQEQNHGLYLAGVLETKRADRAEKLVEGLREALEGARGEIGGILTAETSLSVNRRLCAAVNIIDAALVVPVAEEEK